VPDQRFAIHCYVSELARNTIQEWCDEHGCSMSAFVETLGRHMADEDEPFIEGLARPARRIDAERRRRG
jgi:hypothetical protein